MERTSADRDKEKESSSDRQRGTEQESGSSNAEADPVASLHQTVGNQAVQRLYEEGFLQPKLEVNQPDDEAEREAERVAENVVERSADEVQSSHSGFKSDVRTIKWDDRTGGVIPSVSVRRTDNESILEQTESTVKDGVRGDGNSLPTKIRSEFESKMNADFSDVRVHTDSSADQATESIDAEAYTVGSDIAFADENYDPYSKPGKRLLAHELTHVIQQSDGRSRSKRRIQRQSSESSKSGQSRAPMKRKVEIKVDPDPKTVVEMETEPDSEVIPENITKDYIISKKLREGDPLMKTALYAAAGEFAWDELWEKIKGPIIPYQFAENIKSFLKQKFGQKDKKTDVEEFRNTVIDIYIKKHAGYDSLKDIKKHYQRKRKLQQTETTVKKPEPEQTLYFKFDSTRFNENLTSDKNWQYVVDQVSSYITNIGMHGEGEGVPKITVEGYASPVGPEKYNADLSSDRAKRVAEKLRQAMQGKGTEFKIKPRGKGEAN